MSKCIPSKGEDRDGTALPKSLRCRTKFIWLWVPWLRLPSLGSLTRLTIVLSSVCWDMLMEPQYRDLRTCIYGNKEELKRFRQVKQRPRCLSAMAHQSARLCILTILLLFVGQTACHQLHHCNRHIRQGSVLGSQGSMEQSVQYWCGWRTRTRSRKS